MYKILAHTADIKFRIISKNLIGILKSSLKAINFYLKPKFVKTKKIVKFKFPIKLDYDSGVFIDFLNQILYLIYTKKCIFEIFELDKINKDEIVLNGYPYQSLKKEIKAITYHQANLIKEKKKIIFEFIVDV